MRLSARLCLGLAFSAVAPAAALAGGHAPVVVRPAFHAPPAQGPRVVHIDTKPIYAPPSHAIYGPPRHDMRQGWRRRGRDAGYMGFPAVYGPAAEAAAPAVASEGEYLRPRAGVIYNYAGAPPLWQGDAGYVAQPAIYNVRTVLRRHPLTVAPPHIVK
ncbi:MAG: hypothetical protein QM651_18415 [Rhodoblastus sp.]